jgi:hypothetical protein
LGYRAQFAYPQHVYLPASFARFLPKVQLTFGVIAGVYVSACEEEISLPVFSGMRSHQIPRLHLKNSVYLSAQGFPYEVGLYDTMAPARQSKPLTDSSPDFAPPATGLPGDSCWS